MPPTLSPALRGRLERAARAAVRTAYAPYSRFRVGAAVLAGSGKIYRGANVENASYGLCTCAERAAVVAAVAAGETAIRAVAVYTPTPAPTSPCGSCRQIIREFGPQARIVSVCDGRGRLETTLAELLPESFGPENLNSPRR